jgi:hypothetical protein
MTKLIPQKTATARRVKRLISRALPLCALCALCVAASAQVYSIDWYKISGGGGASTNAQYTLSGTIGQHDASGPMTNGNYSLTGGFWAIYACQTPGAPALGVKLTTTNTTVVYWPSPSTAWTLQTTTNLSQPSWVTPPQSLNDDGTNKYIIIKPTSGNGFYRLNYQTGN